jgi:hypothetical protein
MTAIDSASLESFERLADIGAWLVIFGVVGEGLEIALKICDHKCKNERFLNWYKKHDFCIEIWGGIFWIIVVGGLVMELRYSGKAQMLVKKENSRITQEATDARKIAGQSELEAGDAKLLAANIGTTNAQLLLRVEELRKENVLLRTRRITADQRDRFIDFLKNRTEKFPIKVFVGAEDNETQNYAAQIREMLDSSGFGTGNTNDIQKLGNVTFISNKFDPALEAPIWMVFYATDDELPNVPGLPGLTFRRLPNGSESIVNYTPVDKSGFGCVDDAFGRIGVMPAIIFRKDWGFVSEPGEWAILVPQKF